MTGRIAAPAAALRFGTAIPRCNILAVEVGGAAVSEADDSPLCEVLSQCWDPKTDTDKELLRDRYARPAALARAFLNAAGGRMTPLQLLKLDALCAAWRLSIVADQKAENDPKKELIEFSLKCHERLKKAMTDLTDSTGPDDPYAEMGLAGSVMPLMLKTKGVIEDVVRKIERPPKRRREKKKPENAPAGQ